MNKSIKESIEKLLRVVTRDDKYTIADMDNEINEMAEDDDDIINNIKIVRCKNKISDYFD